MATRLAAGQEIAGRYRLLSPVPGALLGERWRASDDQGPVAHLTVLTPRAGLDAGERDALLAALRDLGHPHAVTVTDAGRHEDVLYVVSAIPQGQSLRAWLADHRARDVPVALRDARLLFDQVTQCLAAAHRCTPPVVHGTTLAESVYVERRGEVQLIATVADLGLLALTEPRNVVLPPGADYAAPTPSDDLHGVGSLLAELLANVILASGGDSETLSARLHAARPEVDTSLWKLVQTCVARDPSQRPVNMGRVRELIRLAHWTPRELRAAPTPVRDAPPDPTPTPLPSALTRARVVEVVTTPVGPRLTPAPEPVAPRAPPSPPPPPPRVQATVTPTPPAETPVVLPVAAPVVLPVAAPRPAAPDRRSFVSEPEATVITHETRALEKSFSTEEATTIHRPQEVTALHHHDEPATVIIRPSEPTPLATPPKPRAAPLAPVPKALLQPQAHTMLHDEVTAPRAMPDARESGAPRARASTQDVTQDLTPAVREIPMARARTVTHDVTQGRHPFDPEETAPESAGIRALAGTSPASADGGTRLIALHPTTGRPQTLAPPVRPRVVEAAPREVAPAVAPAAFERAMLDHDATAEILPTDPRPRPVTMPPPTRAPLVARVTTAAPAPPAPPLPALYDDAGPHTLPVPIVAPQAMPSPPSPPPPPPRWVPDDTPPDRDARELMWGIAAVVTGVIAVLVIVSLATR